jgi:hypothetical protein
MGAYSAVYIATIDSTELTIGGIPWTDPHYAAIEDGKYASVTLTIGEFSDTIDNNTFGEEDAGGSPGMTAFPSLANITGMKLSILCVADQKNYLQITNAGPSEYEALQGSTANGGMMQDALGWVDVGGDGVMFGLTSAQIKALMASSGFGWQFNVTHIQDAMVSVFGEIDGMRMTIYYDLPRLFACMGAGR